MDDIIHVRECGEGADPPPTGTPGYGAPFRHCRVERDQVAMAVVTAEILYNHSWSAYLHEHNVPTDFGWAVRAHGPPEPALHTASWVPGMYLGFAKVLGRMHTKLQRDVPKTILGLLRAVDSGAEFLRDLPEATTPFDNDPDARIQAAGWDYADVHRRVTLELLYALSSSAGDVTLPDDYTCEFMYREGYDSDEFCAPPAAAESLRTWDLPSVPATTPAGVHATRPAPDSAVADAAGVKRRRRT